MAFGFVMMLRILAVADAREQLGDVRGLAERGVKPRISDRGAFTLAPPAEDGTALPMFREPPVKPAFTWRAVALTL